MGQKQSHEKGKQTHKAASNRGNSSRAPALDKDGSSVDPQHHRDHSSQLAEVPEQKSSLSSLETVTCALGSETSLNQAPSQSENTSSQIAVKSEDCLRSDTVAQDNERANGETKSSEKTDESGNSSSCQSPVTLEEQNCPSSARLEEPDLKSSVSYSQTVNETGEHADANNNELDIVNIVRNKIRSNQKRRELHKSKPTKLDWPLEQKDIMSNIKPISSPVRSRKHARPTKVHKLSFPKLSDGSGQHQSCLKQKPLQRNKMLKVDTKDLEEKMTSVREFCDEETIEYATELYQFYKTSTVVQEDNRIQFVLEEENKGNHSQSFPYSNIIFFPDKSKGAAPKRYGPKRLGSVYDTHHTDSEGELADTGSSSHSESEINSTTKPHIMKQVTKSENNRTTKPYITEKSENNSTTKPYITEKVAKSENNSSTKPNITKQVPKSEKQTTMVCTRTNDNQVNGDIDNNVESAVPSEISQFETSPPVTDLSPLKVEAQEIPKDVKDTKYICHDIVVPKKTNLDNFNICVSNIKPVDKIQRNCQASNNGQNSSFNKDYREKSKSLRSCSEEKIAKETVCVDRQQLSVTYHVPVKTAVSELQSSVAPDLDWSRLRSRQARYAVKLRSVRTQPGEDNRMVLEFNLPSFQGQVTGPRTPHKSHSESDFNSVVNDFDDNSIDSVDISLTSNESIMTEDRRFHRCSDCYSEKIIERYGGDVRFLHRRRTDIDEDNRVVIDGNKAILVNFEDEEVSDKSDDDSSIVTSIASSVSSSDEQIESHISTSSDDESNSQSLDTLLRSLNTNWLRHLGGLFGGDTDDLDISSMFGRHIPEIVQGVVADAQKAGSHVSRKPDVFHKYCGVFGRGDNSEDRPRHRHLRRQREEPAETGPGIQLDEQTTEESQTIERIDSQVLTDTGEGDVNELPEDEMWLEIFKAELEKVLSGTELPANSRCTILCLDISASMAGEPWLEMGKALHNFVTALEDVRQNNDVEEQIAVILFGNETRVALPFTNQYNKIMDLFGSLVAGGCSPLIVGLKLCVLLYGVMIEGGKCSLKLNGIPVKPRVIIFTDGHPTPANVIGEDAHVTEEQCAKAEEAISELDMEDIKPLFTVSCVSVSEGTNMDLLEECCARTGGTLVPSLDVAQLATNTYSHYIAAHIGGPMLKKGDDEVDLKVFERLVCTLYPSIASRQMSEVKQIIQQEVERREEETDSRGDKLEADMYFENEELLPLGTKVQKGPDLDVESGLFIPGSGIVINHRCEDEGHVLVRWDNGFKTECSYGNDNKYEVLPDENPKAHACSIDDPIAVGCTVRRGPDWQFGNHDGGSDQLGTVYGIQPGGVVLVRWPNGNIGNYRYNMDNSCDVLISDPKDPYGTEFYTTEMNKRNLRAS